MWIYSNGEFVGKDDAKVSIFDHGFLYGDGIFEGIRAYHGKVFKLKEHIKRLYDSAKAINMTIGISPQEMENLVIETVRRNELHDSYIRLVVSRGVGDLGLDPNKCPKTSIFCIADQIKLFSQTMYEEGIEVRTVATRRNSLDALNPRIKSLNYLNNIFAKIEANQAGVMEAVMLNQDGYVAEGTGDNIFIVRNNVVITPPISAGVLEGITRNAVLEIARELGYETREELFTLFDLHVADEVFLTGTAAELIPVIKVDQRQIGNGNPGPVFKELLSAFRELTKVDGAEIYAVSDGKTAK